MSSSESWLYYVVSLSVCVFSQLVSESLRTKSMLYLSLYPKPLGWHLTKTNFTWIHALDLPFPCEYLNSPPWQDKSIAQCRLLEQWTIWEQCSPFWSGRLHQSLLPEGSVSQSWAHKWIWVNPQNLLIDTRLVRSGKNIGQSRGSCYCQSLFYFRNLEDSPAHKSSIDITMSEGLTASRTGCWPKVTFEGRVFLISFSWLLVFL